MALPLGMSIDIRYCMCVRCWHCSHVWHGGSGVACESVGGIALAFDVGQWDKAGRTNVQKVEERR